ncbi:uncharacterized protein BXIN_2449 [Babesia sp. Xinjiang]|uniref:uncharacterized protein n=1 Tax=Babesia sp. Xinjiang TaxID=462227 RepID=UPI000A250C0B|nr:uncharacterized protein BXIN_2449 [Babesia sp. Xinjiang]ORM41529.1 hypothetical protein BXIN_2449 [Babesia sp. Xinjiang]
MRGCNEITNTTIYALLAALGPRLSYLDLQDCSRLGASCLPPGLKNLKVLSLGYQRRRGKLEDKDVIVHITGDQHPVAPELEWLSLQHRVEAQSLAGVERLAPTLKVLDLRGCTGVPSEEYGRCKSLRILEQLLVGTNLTSDVISEIASSCLKLRVLDISGSDLSQQCIQRICDNLKGLEKLNMSRCKALTNDGLQRILASLPKITLIDVSHCWKLSDSLANHMPAIASKRRHGVYELIHVA